jgi:hypothetical protein
MGCAADLAQVLHGDRCVARRRAQIAMEHQLIHAADGAAVGEEQGGEADAQTGPMA